jgi:hypothetical protein
MTKGTLRWGVIAGLFGCATLSIPGTGHANFDPTTLEWQESARMDAQTAISSNSSDLEQADPGNPGETENIWYQYQPGTVLVRPFKHRRSKPVANAFFEERHCSA